MVFSWTWMVLQWTGGGVDWGGLVSLLQGRIDVAVAHDVTGTAGGHLVDVHVEPALFVPGEKSVVVVDLAALGLVVVAHVAAAPTWLTGKYFKHSAKIFRKHLRCFGHLQTFLHPESLSVVVNIDDIFPLALGRLPSLRLGVLDLGGAEKAALLGEVPVLVGVVLLSPSAVIVAVVIGQLLV